MKTTLLLLITALAIIVHPPCTEAAAVPWVGVLGNGSGGAITVPIGKILVINMFGTSTTSSTYSMTITGTATGGIGSGNFSAPLTIVSSGIGLIVPPSPIRLGPGMTLTNSGNPLTVYGIALDTADFFASASPTSQGLSVADGQLATAIDSRTTVPTQTIGESSTDLQTWTTDGVTVAKSSTNPRISRVSTAADAPSKFLRARLAKRTVSSDSK